MDISLNVILATVALIALGLIALRPLMAAIGKALIIKNTSQLQSRLGLHERQVQLSDGVTAWYIERPPQGDVDGPPLIVLPGATVNMMFMGVRLQALFKSLPHRRIIVIETPHHGRNISLDLDLSLIHI